MSIGNNLKNIRKQNHLTQKQLADIAGVTDKAVSMWEQERREPRMGAIQRVADYFGISKSKIIEEPPFCDEMGVKKNEEIPVVERVLGSGQLIYAQDTLKYNISDSNTNPPTNYIYLAVKDDSMAPTIANGDFLLIHLQSTALCDECVLVSIDGGDGVVRRIAFDKGAVILASDNPYYPKLTFEGEGTLRVKILGLVKKLERNF